MKKLFLIFYLSLYSFTSYSQAEATDFISFVNIEKITTSGLLLFACWALYKKSKDTETKLEEIRTEKDKQIQELNTKIYEYSVKQTEMFSEFKQVVLENTKTLESYGRLLEKISDKISG